MCRIQNSSKKNHHSGRTIQRSDNNTTHCFKDLVPTIDCCFRELSKKRWRIFQAKDEHRCFHHSPQKLQYLQDHFFALLLCYQLFKNLCTSNDFLKIHWTIFERLRKIIDVRWTMMNKDENLHMYWCTTKNDDWRWK